MFKETEEGQTHYCEGCEFEKDGWKVKHTCGKPLQPSKEESEYWCEKCGVSHYGTKRKCEPSKEEPESKYKCTCEDFRRDGDCEHIGKNVLNYKPESKEDWEMIFNEKWNAVWASQDYRDKRNKEEIRDFICSEKKKSFEEGRISGHQFHNK